MLASFRSRLVISNLVITLLGLLVVVVVFTQVLASRSQGIRTNDFRTQSQSLAAELDYLFQQRILNSPNRLQAFVDSQARTLRARVIVVDTRGTPIANSAKSTVFFRGSWSKEDVDRDALAEKRAVTKQLGSGNVRSFQAPLLGTRGHLIGAVILVADVSAVQPGFSELRDVFLIVLGTALLVWLVIGLYFTFSISRPLLRITAATARVAEGHYDARVPAAGHGEIARLAASFNDMAIKVQHTNRLLRDFVANVSHDLRTPLTMIAGFSQALVDGTARPEDVEESARVIHEESDKMQRMVDDLLQLTRLESGLQAFRRQPVNVRMAVQNLVDRTVRVRGEQLTATIENEVLPGLPLAEVDRDQFERALRNLLENALQYTPAGGRVRISAQPIGSGWVEIAVADTGMGIAPEDVPRIFERFYRTDRSRERVHGHSGLGLAIVREIVEGHGGRIEVDSELGRGTTFRFTVPQARVRPLEGQAPPADSLGQTAAQ
jgi:signal transduction histidine kinase